MRFIQASVLFNLGAICSAIACSAGRSDLQGLKTAYNYFQTSAYFFQFINDNFLHPPSVDLSRDSIIVLVGLMLAQAQEVFVEKCLSEKKSGMLICKLSNHLASSYSTVLDGMKGPTLKGQFDNVSLSLMRAKSKYFLAMAFYHRSLYAETQSECLLSFV